MKVFKWLFYPLLFLSCVETYEINIQASKKYLIVEGTLTNIFDEPQTVRLFETSDQTEFTSSRFTRTIFTLDGKDEPLRNATVQVIENGINTYSLTEKEPGIYHMPSGFIAKENLGYQLIIGHPDGRRYESPVEVMPKVPEIKNFSVAFNPRGVVLSRLFNLRFPTHDFFVDFDDPAGEQNFYQWTWRVFENIDFCETCPRSLYDADSDSCFPDSRVRSFEIYDYRCPGFCWEIFEGEDLQIFSDVFTNGQPQKAKLVAQVPVLQANRCLVVIFQQSLSPGAFRYLKLLESQSINSGSLADTPPAPIKSNVKNVNNPDELVIGYFTASSTSELRHMLDRSDAPDVPRDRIFSVLNNRDAFPEPPNLYREIVPFAPCKSKKNRTPNAPRNWQFGE